METLSKDLIHKLTIEFLPLNSAFNVFMTCTTFSEMKYNKKIINDKVVNDMHKIFKIRLGKKYNIFAELLKDYNLYMSNSVVLGIIRGTFDTQRDIELYYDAYNNDIKTTTEFKQKLHQNLCPLTEWFDYNYEDHRASICEFSANKLIVNVIINEVAVLNPQIGRSKFRNVLRFNKVYLENSHYILQKK